MINNDGFDLGAQRKPIEANDLPDAFAYAMAYKEAMLSQTEFIVPDKDVILVEKSKLAESADFNLSGERYIVSSQRNASYPIHILADVITTLTPPNKIKQSDYKKTGKFPIIDQSQNEIAGWSDDVNSLIHINKPVVIFGDHTCCIKYVDYSFCQGADGIKILCSNEEVLPKFLFYYLKSNPIVSNGYKRHYTNLTRLTLPIPPISVQEEIVAELDAYQKIIDGANLVVENWKPRIDVDQNWEYAKLEDICEAILSGGTPSTALSEYWNGDIPWITSADIVDYKTAIPRRYITEAAIKNSATNIIPAGNAIVVTRVGLGKLFYNSFDVCISQDSQGLILKKDIVNAEFIMYCLIDEVAKFKQTSQGTTIQGVTKSQLASIKLSIPSLDIQKSIVEDINSEYQIVKNIQSFIILNEQKIKDRINKIWNQE